MLEDMGLAGSESGYVDTSGGVLPVFPTIIFKSDPQIQ